MTDATIDRLIAKATERANALPPPEERRRIRRAAHITGRDLADALGVSHAILHRWERGESWPRDENLHAYANALERLRAVTENGGAS